MLSGYLRVSKSDGSQTLDLQRDALLAARVAPERLSEDLAAGRKDARPGLAVCLTALQSGNTLVVWKLDCLGRDLKHLVSVADELQQRQVGFTVLTGAGAQIDTTTAHGRLVCGIFAALAACAAERMRERTRAGLAAARARSRRGGRPHTMTPAALRMAMAALVAPTASARAVHVAWASPQRHYRHYIGMSIGMDR